MVEVEDPNGEVGGEDAGHEDEVPLDVLEHGQDAGHVGGDQEQLQRHLGEQGEAHEEEERRGRSSRRRRRGGGGASGEEEQEGRRSRRRRRKTSYPIKRLPLDLVVVLLLELQLAVHLAGLEQHLGRGGGGRRRRGRRGGMGGEEAGGVEREEEEEGKKEDGEKKPEKAPQQSWCT